MAWNKMVNLVSRIPFSSEITQMALVTIALVFAFSYSMLESYKVYPFTGVENLDKIIFSFYMIPNLFLVYYAISNVLAYWALVAEDGFPKNRKPRTLYPVILVIVAFLVITSGGNYISEGDPFSWAEIGVSILNLVLYTISLVILFRAHKDVSGAKLAVEQDEQINRIVDNLGKDAT